MQRTKIVEISMHTSGCYNGEHAQSHVTIWLFTPYFVSDTERKVSSMSDIRTVFIKPFEKPACKDIIRRGIKCTD